MGITEQENAVKCLNDYLTILSKSSDYKDVKKVKLISYWMKDYCNYLKKEKTFDPKKLKRYERGDIVKVNLGYNVGSEEGGLHYAIVLDKNNKLSSPVITIIPLTSLKNDISEIYENDILLGDEIYKKMRLKYDNVSDKISKGIEEIRKQLDSIKIKRDYIMTMYEKFKTNKLSDIEVKEFLKTIGVNDNGDVKATVQEFQDMCLSIIEKSAQEIQEQQNSISYLKKIDKEINRMKKGSIALMQQITTVSKLRIYDPKTIRSVLSGIKLSPDNLNKIDKKLKELYIHE